MQPPRGPSSSVTDNAARQAALLGAFGRHFGSPTANSRRVRIIRAPGRVNLIGEHTDYNDGFVFPMAIEPQALIACRSRDDGLVRLASTAFEGPLVEFSVQRRIESGEPGWANYSRGVAQQLVSAGIPLCGMDAVIDSSVPVGGGLSSSAAIEVATGLALLTLAGLDMDPQRLALVCQQAEHFFAGVPCGIMDQTIVAAGRAGHAMLLDCRDLSKQYIPVDGRELQVVIINSMVRHALTGGEYAERREQCNAGVRHFNQGNPGVTTLRDVSLETLRAAEDVLPAVVYRRCRHVVTEIARTTRAAALLLQNDYDELGRLMLQSHESLRGDFEVSTPELDLLVAEAMTVRGVYGARMTGAGFGGCVIAVVQPRAVEPLRHHILKVYPEKTGVTPDIYVTTATAGASVLE
ncbi:galactokinase [Humisphaera borealis]|uniref:Galactokinase n=1 Tax=Humisphaera borealis TaxID=2807512 RepID=A0A7M2X5E8_9BACT|nr:galactokinase [Humisphaera borealis]QOV92030.1 galactokinase [Humisphaera borealis]